MAGQANGRSPLQRELESDLPKEAETFRITSGKPGEDATDAMEAETPNETLWQISDPTSGASSSKVDEAKEVTDRAPVKAGS